MSKGCKSLAKKSVRNPASPTFARSVHFLGNCSKGTNVTKGDANTSPKIEVFGDCLSTNLLRLRAKLSGGGTLIPLKRAGSWARTLTIGVFFPRSSGCLPDK
jgi:hypothetical protein